ncbi:hypothetical protein KJ742_01100 [Patescibacteria group bacterium]|nr:hypothetical protein [Patescibacteria group bacterium]MBU1682521.1 hypothetical protein [Patescibacteria group bacterium]
MPSTDAPQGKPTPTDKEYVDIIKSDVEVDKEYIKDTGIPTKIVYYCRDCEKTITPKRIGKKLRFSCPECKRDGVAFGSEQSIINHYHIKQGAGAEQEQK